MVYASYYTNHKSTFQNLCWYCEFNVTKNIIFFDFNSRTSSSYCVCLKSITICNFLSSFSSSASLSYFFLTIGEFGTGKYFADHRIANTTQLFFSIKENLSVLFNFWTSCNKGEFSRDYLINVATCLFAHN